MISVGQGGFGVVYKALDLVWSTKHSMHDMALLSTKNLMLRYLAIDIWNFDVTIFTNTDKFNKLTVQQIIHT